MLAIIILIININHKTKMYFVMHPPHYNTSAGFSNLPVLYKNHNFSETLTH